MPILKLIPACKDYIWGGTKLITDYHKDFSGERLAETWELSCHPDGPSVIANGTFAGRTLREYIADKGFRVIPKKIAKKYVGHSPDFIESLYYHEIFDLYKKRHNKPKGLWLI